MGAPGTTEASVVSEGSVLPVNNFWHMPAQNRPTGLAGDPMQPVRGGGRWRV